MNIHKEMYDSLMKLCSENEAFLYRDYVLKSENFRVFDYRLASYSDWLNPYALDCRGITFKTNENGDYHSLVSRPFRKFFNLYENPFTMDLDLSQIVGIYEKMDGSLIVSMMVDGEVWLKSKGSLVSDHAFIANKLLHTEEYTDLLKFIEEKENNGFTVCLEYTDPHPDFRIVVGYDKPELTVLGVIDDNTGNEMSLNTFNDHPASKFFVKDVINEVDDRVEFVKEIPQMEKIEGYVIRLSSGQRVKIKTDWYMKLHHVKDSINSQRRLFEAVVYETVDDIRSQFHDDEGALQLIDEMQEKVSKIYNHLVNTVETFYDNNKSLSQKEYAILGQKELDKSEFGLAMSLYHRKDINYKEFLIKHRKDFGIKDDPEEEI